MGTGRSGLAAAPFRPLTKQQIDRRIERLVSELLAVELGPQDPEDPSGRFRPRWICPAELIRRVRPFVSLN
jgi:hypothetical protein